MFSCPKREKESYILGVYSKGPGTGELEVWNVFHNKYIFFFFFLWQEQFLVDDACRLLVGPTGWKRPFTPFVLVV